MMREMKGDRYIHEERWIYRDKQCKLQLNKLLLHQCPLHHQQRGPNLVHLYFQIIFGKYFFLFRSANTNGARGHQCSSSIGFSNCANIYSNTLVRHSPPPRPQFQQCWCIISKMNMKSPDNIAVLGMLKKTSIPSVRDQKPMIDSFL